MGLRLTAKPLNGRVPRHVRGRQVRSAQLAHSLNVTSLKVDAKLLERVDNIESKLGTIESLLNQLLALQTPGKSNTKPPAVEVHSAEPTDDEGHARGVNVSNQDDNSDGDERQARRGHNDSDDGGSRDSDAQDSDDAHSEASDDDEGNGNSSDEDEDEVGP